jgi:hypothetical protein
MALAVKFRYFTADLRMPKLQKLSIAKLGGKKRGIKEW